MLRQDRRDNHHECTGGAADLNLRTTQKRHQEPAYDRRVNSRLGRDTGCDTEGHCHGQGHQSHGASRD